MRRYAVLLAILLVVAAAAALLWTRGGEDVVTTEAGKPTVVERTPPVASGSGGPSDLVLPRPGGSRQLEGARTPSTQGTVSLPLSPPPAAAGDSSGNALPSASWVDLRIERVNRLFPAFSRYEGGVDVDVVGTPAWLGEDEVLYAPAPRALVQAQIRVSAGLGLGAGAWRPGGYVALSPVRIWGFEPAAFAFALPGGFDLGVGAVVEVYDRLDVGAAYMASARAPAITIGYGFSL